MATICDTQVRGDLDELLSKLVVQTSDAIVCVNCSTNEVVLFNPGAEKMFGWSASEILGKHITNILPVQVHKDMQQTETVGTFKDGEQFPVELTISVLNVNGNQFCAAIVRHAKTEGAALRKYRQDMKKKLLREMGAIMNLTTAARS